MSVTGGTVLVVDDDKDMRWAVRTLLSAGGVGVAEAGSAEAGLEIAASRAPDAVLLDLRMPGMGGDEALRRLRYIDKNLPVIMVTGYGSIPGAIEAIRAGAFDYITKPFRNEQLLDAVRRAVARRRAAPAAAPGAARAALTAVMGHGPAIQALADQVEAVSDTDYSVLIQGETGTGKEVVARCLQQNGARARRPFVVVDCGSMVDTLIDSELFGAEKGAYTGAVNRRQGWFEAAADGGTLFLDEIGNLSTAGQKALLRAIEQRVIYRVGSTSPIKVDTRVIAATNEPLDARIQASTFREDLFFRLAEYVIRMPPLRARPEDIEFLACRFLKEACEALDRPTAELAPAALDLMCGYDWPGNVRELRNVVRRIVLTARDVVTAAHIAACLKLSPRAPAAAGERSSADGGSLRGQVRARVRAIERDAVLEALEQAAGNKAEAARRLGLDYKTYRTKLKMLGPRAVADGHAAA